MRGTPGRRPWAKGFTLIETLVFVVVVGILVTGVFSVLGGMLRHATDPGRNTQAALLAQERMELIAGQRRALGFAGFTASTFDPCTTNPPSSQPVCTALPAGYTITTALADNWGGDPNYKVVTVDVSGPASTRLNLLVASY